MQIAMISEHASPLADLGTVDAGGQNLHVARLSAAVTALGHHVRVYTRRTDPAQPPRVTAPEGYEVVHVPAGPPAPIRKDALLPYMPRFGRWLASSWERYGRVPDAVHAHFWMSGLAALVARDRIPRPLVQTFHALGTVKFRYQGDQDTSPAGRIAAERRVGQEADRIVAQCQDEVWELLALGAPAGRIAVIPSGVDTTAFTPDGPAASRSPERPRLLSVGRLVPRKGFDLAILALRQVPEAELVIVGGPPADQFDGDPEVRRLRKTAAKAEVADRVRLVGPVPHSGLPQWYRSADILVCAPRYEPFGLTTLEGMACGNPVVATAVGGLTDSVADGETGELVGAPDPVAIGNAVRRLLSDPARRHAYAAAAVNRARHHYPWSATAAQLVSLYRIAGERSPAVAAQR